MRLPKWLFPSIILITDLNIQSTGSLYRADADTTLKVTSLEGTKKRADKRIYGRESHHGLLKPQNNAQLWIPSTTFLFLTFKAKRFQHLCRSTITQNTTFPKWKPISDSIKIPWFIPFWYHNLRAHSSRDLWEYYGHEPNHTSTDSIIFISVIATTLIFRKNETWRT